MRCELCDERMTEDEARQCATCAAVLEDSISSESLFAQNMCDLLAVIIVVVLRVCTVRVCAVFTADPK